MSIDQINISTHCNICGKPFTYIGDVPSGGWDVGQEPYCTGHKYQPALGGFTMPEPTEKVWKFCPHCGEKLK